MIETSKRVRPRSVSWWFCCAGGVLALSLVAGGCNWNPRMVHPNTFTSGKTLPAGRVEIAGQFFPGAALAVGLGRGFETRLGYCIAGEDIIGGEGQLTKTVWHDDYVYISSTAAWERFDAADPHDFDGWRGSIGATFSRYNKAGWFGFHVPVRAYYMEYDWIKGFDEYRPSLEGEDLSGTGWVVTAGLGVSFEQPHWALRFAVNGPLQDSVKRVEVLPYVALQGAVRF